jgi:hypothetical protein
LDDSDGITVLRDHQQNLPQPDLCTATKASVRHQIISTFRPAVFDGEALAFNVASFIQTLPEGSHTISGGYQIDQRVFVAILELGRVEVTRLRFHDMGSQVEHLLGQL